MKIDSRAGKPEKTAQTETPQSSLVLRRRNGWEACDSGVLLWRKNFLPVFLFPAFFVLAIALSLRLTGQTPLVSCAALFWLKPLTDRLVLHVISIRFFRPDCPLRELPGGLGKNLFRGLPGDLLWRRFSPWRAARLPVRVLENLKGGAYRKRLSSLREGNLPFCFFLTVFCLALEVAVFTGESGFIFIMMNMFGDGFSFGPWEFFQTFEYAFFGMWCFNLLFVESLYTAMGFGLYIGSRVAVEGWDIQLLFQKAVRSARPAAGALVKVFLLCAFLTAFPSGEAFAEERPAAEYTPPPLDESIGKELEKALASPDFGGEADSWEIRRRKPETETPDSGKDAAGFLEEFFSRREFFGKLRAFSGSALRAFLVVCVAAAAGFVFFRYYRTKRKNPPDPSKPRARSAGSVIADEPAGLLEKSRALYADGDLRGAWAHCLKSARAAYTASRGIVFPPDATEYGCLSLVRGAGEDASGGFARLLRLWILFAYAGRVPPESAFEEAHTFCRALISGTREAADA